MMDAAAKDSATKPAPVIVRLREMIARGDLPPGRRLTEIELAEQMGVSRTPIRQALPALAQEGLLARVGARGYEVRSFKLRDILDGMDVRGAIEGLAARAVAERGAPESLVQALKSCLAEGDELLDAGLIGTAETRYVDMNRRFHSLIVDAAASPVIDQALQRNNAVPFAAADAPVFSHTQRDALLGIVRYAHRQHHAIVDALANGQGGRVEALFREHVYAAKESLRLVKDKLENGGVAASMVRLFDA
jgi:GntR family transcriptional regulator, vanillate catabolism transcriptional regulator